MLACGIQSRACPSTVNDMEVLCSVLQQTFPFSFESKQANRIMILFFLILRVIDASSSIITEAS